MFRHFLKKKEGLQGHHYANDELQNALRQWLQRSGEQLLPVGNKWPCSKVKEDCSTKMERTVKISMPSAML
jgi:hypothetical protein